ncbi:MAG: hypothetical protein ACR2GD_13715 [Pyrinomonadaceae bacterium]
MRIKILQAFRNFNWKQWLLFCAFILVICFTCFHLYRTIERAAYWRAHHDQPIADWMTVGYIAHSYHVPPTVLYDALGLKPEPHDRRTLSQIATAQNRSAAEVKKDLEEAVNNFRAAHPPPENGGHP